MGGEVGEMGGVRAVARDGRVIQIQPMVVEAGCEGGQG